MSDLIAAGTISVVVLCGGAFLCSRMGVSQLERTGTYNGYIYGFSVASIWAIVLVFWFRSYNLL